MSDFKEYAGDLAEASKDVYGSYSYAAGYFQSVAVDMFRYLSVADQQQFLRQMRDAANKMVDSIDA
jgi:hypothetical protein